MRVLIDVNLSVRWVRVLESHGFEAAHWSEVGARAAVDATLLQHASRAQAVLLTADLDFGQMLAAPGARGPSVIQLRGGCGDDAAEFGFRLVVLLRSFAVPLAEGAFLSTDGVAVRIRALPLRGWSRSPL